MTPDGCFEKMNSLSMAFCTKLNMGTEGGKGNKEWHSCILKVSVLRLHALSPIDLPHTFACDFEQQSISDLRHQTAVHSKMMWAGQACCAQFRASFV